ncbi:hypothetical protein OU800_22160 [Pseudomonas sp. GOM7]|uniref:hypothetical protein n=1 Tax=Pseudomonas sp. GOM7 TaxID=2998079 RepID=UPI00227A16BB|nr:hypothetical protein [Pseudomonas sp. GOM7]WAJ37280.1 hypothetical protein OU800_22160 [Pseudomonas sp. GOM7]
MAKQDEIRLYCNLPRDEDALCHLTEAQIEQIYSRYLHGEKLVDLANEYGILSTDHRLNVLLPAVFRTDKPCPYCHSAMEQKRRAKSSREEKPLKCLLCGHKVEVAYGIRRQCACVNCMAARKIFREKQARAQLDRDLKAARILNTKPEGVGLALLSIRKVFLLLGLMSCEENLNGDVVRTGDKGAPLMATSLKLTRDFLAELCESGLIKACEQDIPSEAESHARAGRFERFTWELNVLDEQGQRITRSTLSVLLQRKLTNEFRPYWEDDVYDLAQSLVLDEAIAFLEYHLREGLVTFRAHNRLNVSLAVLVREFPLSAIYAMIWRACASAKDALVEGRVNSPDHAGNLIPGIIDNLAKRRRMAETGHDSGRKYNRNGVLREGTVAQYLSAFLGVPDVLFTYGLDQLREKLLRPRLALESSHGRGEWPVSAADVAKKIMVALRGDI